MEELLCVNSRALHPANTLYTFIRVVQSLVIRGCVSPTFIQVKFLIVEVQHFKIFLQRLVEDKECMFLPWQRHHIVMLCTLTSLLKPYIFLGRVNPVYEKLTYLEIILPPETAKKFSFEMDTSFSVLIHLSDGTGLEHFAHIFEQEKPFTSIVYALKGRIQVKFLLNFILMNFNNSMLITLRLI